MVDDPRDALECFGSAPVDLLAIGPFVVRRADVAPGGTAGGRHAVTEDRDVRRGRPDPGTALACDVLLDALAAAAGPRARPDRRGRRPAATRPRPPLAGLPDAGRRIEVVRGAAAAGPAAARNVGWRRPTPPWVVFLDDDVRAGAGLAAAARPPTWRTGRPTSAASQGRIARAAAGGRRPTDWERDTAGLATPAGSPPTWPTGAPRCVAVGGFDERFPRAFREDADLALRVAGRRLAAGARRAARRAPGAPGGPLGQRARAGAATPTTR